MKIRDKLILNVAYIGKDRKVVCRGKNYHSPTPFGNFILIYLTPLFSVYMSTHVSK